nr:DUF3630 family protein [Alteromonas sp. ASW11-130]
MPIPQTVQETNLFIKQFTQCTHSQLINAEWGADRYQAVFEKDNRRYCLHIEWLCDAMWIESHHSDFAIKAVINLLIR